MMRFSAVLLAAFAWTVNANPAYSAPITIDFDGFASGTNIDGVNLGGVTVTSADASTIASGGGGVGFISSPNSVQNFAFAKNNPLVFTFDDLVSFVTLTGGDQGVDTDQFRVTAYDDMNNIIDQVTTPVFGGNALSAGAMSDFFTTTVSGAGIRRVEVLALINAGIGVDNLQFEPIPEPASLAVFALVGLTGAVVARRRKAPVA